MGSLENSSSPRPWSRYGLVGLSVEGARQDNYTVLQLRFPLETREFILDFFRRDGAFPSGFR